MGKDLLNVGVGSGDDVLGHDLAHLLGGAGPASTAALTAPTSPRTITVTKPEPIFS